MVDAEYEYGKIFVDAEFSVVREYLGRLFGTESGSSPSLWVDQGVEIEVRNNPDRGAAADFIGWPTFVEIVPETGDTANTQVLAVAQRVSGELSRAFGQTVTAADYEEMM